MPNGQLEKHKPAAKPAPPAILATYHSVEQPHPSEEQQAGGPNEHDDPFEQQPTFFTTHIPDWITAPTPHLPAPSSLTPRTSRASDTSGGGGVPSDSGVGHSAAEEPPVGAGAESRGGEHRGDGHRGGENREGFAFLNRLGLGRVNRGGATDPKEAIGLLSSAKEAKQPPLYRPYRPQQHFLLFQQHAGGAGRNAAGLPFASNPGSLAHTPVLVAAPPLVGPCSGWLRLGALVDHWSARGERRAREGQSVGGP